MNQKVATDEALELEVEQIDTESREVAPIAASSNTPMEMLSMAAARGAPMEELKHFMELRDHYEAGEAKKAFLHSIAAFKENPPTVINDMLNPQYNSTYSSLANFVNVVNKSMAPHGLSTDWEFDQSDETIKVTCVLSHEMGHSKSVSLSGPPDESGKKNSLQQIKSTLTYLKLATFEGVTGIASRAGNTDDDGAGATNNGAANNGEPKWECVSADQLQSLNDLIKESGTDQARFLEWCDVDKLEHLPAANFKASMDALTHKKNSTKQPEAEAK